MKELAEILGRIHSDFDLDDVLSALLKSVLEATEATRAVLIELDPEKEAASDVIASTGTPLFMRPGDEHAMLLPVAKSAIETGRIVGTKDAMEDEHYRGTSRRAEFRIRRFGAVPLSGPHRSFGAIVYHGETPGGLSREAIASLTDIAHLAAIAVELDHHRQLRVRDEVTGLMSFRRFMDRLNEETVRCNTHGRHLSLVHIDPDREESDPDRLKTIAGLIHAHLRPGDHATRIDDTDRFYLLLPETEHARAIELAESLRTSVEESALGNTVSVGVAGIPRDAVNTETLLLTIYNALETAQATGNVLHDSSGPARADHPDTDIVATLPREGRALDSMLETLFSGEAEIQTRLDLAVRLLASSFGSSHVLLAILASDRTTIWSARFGTGEGEAAQDLVRKASTSGKREIESDGARAIPLREGEEVLGVLYLAGGESGPYERRLLRTLAAHLARSLSNSEEIRKRRTEIREREESLAKAVAELREKYDFSAIVGGGEKLTKVLQLIARAAEMDAPVLITGESGTGKEIVARAVHANSDRNGGKFVVLNCAAVPPALIESELFGHTRGSFTSAVKDRKGMFETADGGTIFLDEIGEIPVEIQAKLLRAIQFGEIQRIGSDDLVHARARVISASNRDLQEQVRRREFREDLYYRINVFRIHTPPLREHREDIPALVTHFCKKLAAELGRESVTPDPELLEKLLQYSYPGNVRELENILLRAVAMSSGSVLTVKDLPAEMLDGSSLALPVHSPRTGEELESMKKIATRGATNQLEEAFVKFALTKGKGNVSEAARQTAIERTRLQKLVRKHGIDPKIFKL